MRQNNKKDFYIVLLLIAILGVSSVGYAVVKESINGMNEPEVVETDDFSVAVDYTYEATGVARDGTIPIINETQINLDVAFDANNTSRNYTFYIDNYGSDAAYLEEIIIGAINTKENVTLSYVLSSYNEKQQSFTKVLDSESDYEDLENRILTNDNRHRLDVTVSYNNPEEEVLTDAVTALYSINLNYKAR